MENSTKGDSLMKRSIRESSSRTVEQSSTANYENSFTSDLTPEGRQTARVTKARFEPVVGKSTQTGWGVVHLYRDDDETNNFESGTSTYGGQDESTILCIPAVPVYLTPNYFLAWVGEETREQVSHIRMVMTGQLMQYLVLMKFRESKAARLWKECWDGRAFKGVEPETCRAVYIRTITFSKSPSTSTPSSTSFPALTHDPFTPHTASHVELPTCPVCLERMDDTTGLLTILCQHVFHCACLLKWKDSSCPVCRYTNPNSVDIHQERPFGSGEASLCKRCNCADDLWICLICGNVGCGRYKGGHAKEHWKDSAHCFALEIETQHVWDYAGDVWVHRLIRNKGDNSKVMELPNETRHGLSSDHSTLSISNGEENLVPRNKLEVLGIEYTHLLTSQLESQRLYYEDLLGKSAAESATASSKATSLAMTTSKALQDLQVLNNAHDALKAELTTLTRELEREKYRAEKSVEIARKLSKDLIEERHVSEGLMQRIEHLNKTITRVTEEQAITKAENAELQDTNRDLLFCLSAGRKVQEMETNGDSGLAQGELSAGVISLPDLSRGAKEKEKHRGKGNSKGKSKAR